MPNGETTESISVSLPGWLIDELDSARERLDLTRSDFMRRAVRKYILLEKDCPEFWRNYRKNHPGSHIKD